MDQDGSTRAGAIRGPQTPGAVQAVIVTPSTVAAGIWREVPRQPKQRRCHECGKRTFYWLLEPDGAICRDCVNLRNMPKLAARTAPVENGKKRKSTIAPVVKNAIIAKRATGQSKLSIAKDVHVAPGTVRRVLDEADFDQLIQEGRSNCAGLLPQAIDGLKQAFARGEGATCCRFLEGMNVLGENAIESVRANTVRQRGAINVLVHGGVTVQAAAAEKTINAEVVSSSATITTATSSDSPPSSQP